MSERTDVSLALAGDLGVFAQCATVPLCIWFTNLWVFFDA